MIKGYEGFGQNKGGETRRFIMAYMYYVSGPPRIHIQTMYPKYGKWLTLMEYVFVANVLRHKESPPQFMSSAELHL